MIFPFSANKDTDCSIWRHVASRHISTRKYIRGFSPEIRFFQSFAFAKCTTIEVFYLTSKTVRCSGCDVFFRVFFLNVKQYYIKLWSSIPANLQIFDFLYTYRWWLIHVYKRRVLADITFVNTFLFVLLYSIGLCINTVFNHAMMKKNMECLANWKYYNQILTVTFSSI